MRLGKVSNGSAVAGEFFHQEIMECDKHEIIVKISSFIGESPTDLCVAEMIFEHIKYDIARYIISHEFKSSCADAGLVCWLEEKTSPEGIELLTTFINNYLK